jgi:hypothetical protein
MIGDVVHVTLPYGYFHYTGSGNCYSEAMLDVMRMLDTNSNIYWPRYDLWRYNSSTQDFEMEPDDNIDMMYVQFRHADMCGMTSGGYGALYVDYTTLNYNKEINGCGICYEGSGLMGINGWKMSMGSAIGYFRHEYCHYTLGWHRPYSTILGQDGTQLCIGSELGFSPQDLITVGLADVTTYSSLTGDTYTLEDLTTTGDVLKVPTSTTGEYFLVSNRRRLASNNGYTWDCNMTGDTAMGSPFLQFGDYSKGLYIYHVTSGDNFEAWADLEAADGLYNWSLSGYNSTPDWSSSQQLPVIHKIGVGYSEDNPLVAVSDNTRMSSRDGQSVIDYTYSTGTGYHCKWFSKGERHTSLGDQGVDRVYSNLTEDWCSRESMGDRWDAWTLEDNVIFSPYSSPNTKDRNNNNTGIFIYYTQLANDVATVKVYQADANSSQEATILANTPPSRPPLFRPIEIVACNNTYGYPRITWDNNLEPDMLRNSEFKRYKIYRAASEGLSSLPASYTYIGTYDDYTPTDTVSYIDYQTIISCGFVNENERYYRYKVTAVDSYDDESVKSDFVATPGAATVGGGGKPNSNNSEPLKFNLRQNYPNPFNPATEIKYSIPVNTFVTINIYNLLGQNIASLVNEYKNAGEYSVIFDGTNHSSGIYFYTIEAGNYKDSKKMVLIK